MAALLQDTVKSQAALNRELLRLLIVLNWGGGYVYIFLFFLICSFVINCCLMLVVLSIRGLLHLSLESNILAILVIELVAASLGASFVVSVFASILTSVVTLLVALVVISVNVLMGAFITVIGLYVGC